MPNSSPMPFWYRLLFYLFRGLLHLLTRLEVSGREHIPASGPLIVAPNHLHVLDPVLVFSYVPLRMTAFAAEKWEGTPTGWFLSLVANAIFVERGEPDRDALTRALAVLREGGVLGIAPEGTRSRGQGLLPGKDGAVYLASRSGATILPVAMWGHETATSDWLRLRRPRVTVRFLPPITLPANARNARTAQLQVYTDEIMLALAAALPPAYRGVYAERVAGSGD